MFESNPQPRGPFCEFDTDQMRSVSDGLARLADAIENSAGTSNAYNERFLVALVDLTKAIHDLRVDILPAAMGREQVPLKVLYICVIVTAAAGLGVAAIKQLAGIL